MHKIIITERALRDLDAFDEKLRKRIGEKLRQFATDPAKYARKLNRPELGSFRFRIGNYRVIFDIDGDTIVVLRIGHRREIYR